MEASSSSNAINTDENVNDNDVALSVPTNPKDFAKIFGEEPYKMIVKFAMQLKLRRNPRTPLTAEQTKHLKWILRALSSINALTPDLEKELHLRQSLEVVMGDHIQCRQEKSAWQFPDDCIAIALAAHEKYTSESWGKNDDLQDDADATDDATAAPAASITAVATTLTIPTPHPITLTAIRRAPATHPIYGATGIMRGIIVDNSGKTRSYKIDDQYPSVPYKVFGNNGLVIGQWWPLQICALRDGAHGMRIAGIAGSQSMGVTSIVVSGLYTALDTDNGPTLHYSAPQSHLNITPTPIRSAGAKALQTSLGTRRPVRVLRAAGGDSHLCPAVGIRYDGLYTVVGQATGTNAKGGAYLRFRLDRVAGQAPVDLSRPTAGEKGEFARVKAGY
ncbi:MAG: hypothetical protein FRX48_03868 [Lasallia pustulata]|uniref:YDG domain-containing protein n=1 Tax=Lasallia pustulata TaxID=136370 RepID=A0A5M8PV70_9LECA|nr:MAG: hypothetical protein FRX48_03868 [Lasallia pustulata]